MGSKESVQIKDSLVSKIARKPSVLFADSVVLFYQ